MVRLTEEETFIFNMLKEKGGNIGYKELQSICEDHFEGVRLILKKMKENGIVDFEGPIPGFSSVITLNKDVNQPNVK